MTESRITKDDFMGFLGLKEERDNESFPLIESQKDQLLKFMQGYRPNSLVVGDIVRRNEFGRSVFRYPSDKQIGVVVSIFDNTVITDNEPYNVNIAVIDKMGCVVLYPMFDAYLERTGESIYNYKAEDNDARED